MLTSQIRGAGDLLDGDLARNIRRIRDSWFKTNDRLDGKIRCADHVVPFRVSLKPQFVELAFNDEVGRFRIPIEGTVVQEFRDGRWTLSTSASFTTAIPGTAVTLEDIAFKFLFWSDVKKTGTGMVRTKLCAIVRFTPRLDESAYSAVELWLDEDSVIPLRAVCYGSDGKEAKRFDPIKLRRIGDEWIVQLIRVTRFSAMAEPGWAPTYIEFEAERPLERNR